MGFTSDGSLLLTPAGAKVRFGFKIMHVVEDGDQCYVILDAPKGVVFNDNVFCVGLDGQIRWQVENELKGDEFSFYGGATVEDGKLFLFNFAGFTVLVDRNDGRVTEVRFDKGIEATW